MNNGNNKTEKKTVKLLDGHGCLTQEALLGFAFDRLPPQQIGEAASHIQHCEICSDALEGIQLFPAYENADEALQSVRMQINERSGRQDASFTISVDYLKIAAVILLLILFSGIGYYGVKQFTSSEKEKMAHKETAAKQPIAEAKEKKVVPGTGEEKPDTETQNELIAAAEPDTFIEDIDDEEAVIKSAGEALAESRVAKTKQTERKISPLNSSESPAANSATPPPIAQDSPKQKAPVAGLKIAEDEASFSNGMGMESLTGSSTAPLSTKGKKKENKKNENRESKTIYTAVDQMPEFPGGQPGLITFIKMNLRYPESVRETGIEGKVYTSFIVGANGKVKDIKIDKGLYPALDQEAVRVIQSMPDWKPGIQNGNPVAVKFFLPVQFNLSDHD